MLEPVKPQEESNRLSALCNLHMLDTLPEERFDRITRSAQRMFGVPIALISLIDDTRQWFKSRQGLAVAETVRRISFCAHTILIDEPFIVEDASADTRFADNPLVNGEPAIRFYAGVPLHSRDGYKVGTLCIIDRVARTFNDADIAGLRDLAAWAESELNAYTLGEATTIAVESELRLRAIVNNVVDGIVTFDERGAIERVNASILRIFGYQFQEIIGCDITMLMSEPYRTEYEGYLRKYRESGTTSTVGIAREVLGRRKDGTTFPLDLAINEMWLKDRQCFVGIMRDISERRRGEEKLHENTMLLQTVMDSTSSYVHVRDLDGRFLYVNKEYEKVFGFVKEEVLGKTIEDTLPPELARASREGERAVIQSGIALRTEAVVQQDDGPHTYLVVRSPLFNEQGEVYGACGVGTDITQSKQDEQAMRELNRQLSSTTGLQHAILNSANFAIISIDINGVIRLFSRGAQRMLGYDENELVNRQTPLILHDRDEVAARARQLSIELGYPVEPGIEAFVAKARGGMADEQEWTLIHKNGQRFPVMLSVTALWDDQLQLSGFLGIAYDVTERKKIEHMKNEFISTVSHELRTPLTSIRGSLGLLAAGTVGEIPARAQALLDIAKNNCERLVRLINDILDIEKIESGNMRFDIVMQPMLPLVEQAIVATQSFAAQYKVKLELQPDAANAYVMVDADRITQVIVNLLSNAAKFSSQGATVQVRLMCLPRCVRLSVKDHGYGIKEGFRGRIFQKFAQADASDTRQKGGTGLGLSISKAIIEKHHGRIDFHSELGVGSEFYFDLPLVTVPVGRTQGLGRILICEDDPDIAKLLEVMLAQAGFSSDVAYDAGAARRLLAAGSYEAMTLDLVLPGEDGISLLRWMRAQENTRCLPIVIVSALAQHDHQNIVGGAVGIVDWIEKPIDQTRLLAAVQAATRDNKDGAPSILHVEDDIDLANVVAALVGSAFKVTHAATLADARSKLARDDYDLILLDLYLSDGNGWDLLASLPQRNASTPVVIFSGQDASRISIDNVHAALVKSRTSNDQLLAIIHNLIGQPRTVNALRENQ